MTGAVTADSRRGRPGDLFVAVPGSGSTVTTSWPAARRQGRPARSTARAVDALPCVVVADPVAALGRLAAGVHARLVVGGLRTLAHHRLLGQDLDQGPARPGARRGGPDRGPPGS